MNKQIEQLTGRAVGKWIKIQIIYFSLFPNTFLNTIISDL